MEYFYNVKLTDNKSVNFREMTLYDYKNLQKICVESDMKAFMEYIKRLIHSCSIDPIDFELNLIDVFIAVMNIRKYSVDDTKRFMTYVRDKEVKLPILLDNVIGKVVSKYNELSMDKIIEVDHPIIKTITLDASTRDSCVKKFDTHEGEEFLYSEQAFDLLPVTIKNQIDEYINDVYATYKAVKLFSIHNKDGVESKVLFNLDDVYIYDILKIFLTDDLTHLYKGMFDMKKHLNIGFDEHRFITYSEYELYISIYNSTQEDEKDSSGNMFDNMNLQTPMN